MLDHKFLMSLTGFNITPYEKNFSHNFSIYHIPHKRKPLYT